jgi:glycosyltransferase involved in cell wall biosynthesis
MRVAQITTSLKGGAGIAAVRLSQALVHVGVDSEIVSQRTAGGRTSLSSKATTILQRFLVQSSSNLVTTFSHTALTSEAVENFDILHFHSTYNLVKIGEILQHAGDRPVFITLHDQRSITGGCHYSGECVQFSEDCSHCPQVKKLFWSQVAREKKLVNDLLQSSQVHIVSPSTWLAEITSQIIPPAKPVHIVRNPIPATTIADEINLVKELRLEEKKFVIGFVSANLTNPLKGIEDLFNALNKLPLDIQRKIHLLLVGKSSVNFRNENISTSSFVMNNDILIENPYAFMNLLLVPSRQDNSPNVIGEAFMSGTRVIGSSVGGIPELLNELDCAAVDTTSPNLFAKAILREMQHKYSRAELSQNAQKIFGFSRIGDQVKSLYQEALRNA